MSPRRSSRAGETERTLLRQLYRPAEEHSLWSVAGRPTRQALAVIDVLGNAALHGLRPTDYDADTLRAQAAPLDGSAGPVPMARFDVTVSRSLLRLISDLHRGRVDPQALGFHLPHSHESVELVAIARNISIASDVPQAIAAVMPPYDGYVALERALARYRGLAADVSLRPPAAARTLRPGDSYADAGALRRLLVAFGDLTPNDSGVRATAAVERYDSSLVEGVRAFQVRHGLDPDGVIGPTTMAQLRVPLARRVRQIELTLERWRWLPDRAPGRYTVVNIPAFRLYAFEDDSTAQQPAIAMNVIVGKAQGRHATPVFTGEMREVVFRPYWDVPPRIARNELVPIIRRQPGYFDRESLEIVRTGSDGGPTYAPTRENLARVAAGSLRLRQRPGPDNALGLVKFVFPNAYSVYLHGTPAQSLFARARRDFSHGCIRAEDPPALAEFVLRGQAEWDSVAIDSAMHGKRTIRVRIARPMAVYVLYATVVARHETVFFYPDLYGRDSDLERALGLRLERAVVAARGI